MVSLLERQVASIQERLVVLAPAGRELPSRFCNVIAEPARRESLMDELQRLRGAVYLEDGALRRADLHASGRYRIPQDGRSWHLLRLGAGGRVRACVWLLEHPRAVAIDRLRVGDCPLATSDEWRGPFNSALQSEIARAATDRVGYIEIGGWAVDRPCRRTADGIMLALSAFGLGRFLGGAIGIATATVRHASSRILRRLGGSRLESDGTAIPAYFDPRYGCEMELLRFDSRDVHPRYDGLIDLLAGSFERVPVFGATGNQADDEPETAAA